MGIIFKSIRKAVEAPVKSYDKFYGNLKCPKFSCRSADIRLIKSGIFGKTYHCNRCGRTFKA